MSAPVHSSPPGTSPRRGKKWLLALGGLLVVLVLLVLLTPVITDAVVRPKVVAALRDSLNGEPAIGKLSFSLFNGLELADLRIGNPSGFSDRPCVTVERVTADPSLLSLLAGKVVLNGSLHVVKPQIFIEQDVKGRLNFACLAKEQKPSAPPAAALPEGKPAAEMAVAAPFVIASLLVEDLGISLKTPSLPQPVALSPLRIETRVDTLDKPVTLAVKNTDGSLDVKGHALFARDGKLDIPNIKAEFDYTIAPALLAPLTPALNSIGSLKKFEGTLAGAGHLALDGLAKPSGKGWITLDVPQVVFQLVSGETNAIQIFKPGTIRFAYDFKARDARHTDLDLQLTSPAASATMKGVATADPAAPVLEGDVTVSADIAALAERFPGVFATERKLHGRIAGGIKGFKVSANTIEGNLDIRSEGLSETKPDGARVLLVRDLAARLQLAVNVEKGIYRVESLDAHVDDAFDAKGRLQFEKKGAGSAFEADIRASANLNALVAKARRFTDMIPSALPLAGRVNAHLTIPPKASSQAGMPLSLHVEINGLKTTGVQIPYGEVDLTGVGSPGWTKVEFKSASLMARVLPAGAAANLQPLEIKMAGRGTADLNAGRYEVPELRVTMPGATLSTVASVVLPKSGNIGAATVRATANATGNIQSLFELARVWGVSLEGMDGSGNVTAQIEADGTLAQLAVKKLHAEVKDLVMKGSKAPAAIRWPQTLTCDIVTTVNAIDPLKTPIEILSGTARIAGIEVASLKGKLALDPKSDQSDLQIAGSLDPVALAAAAPGYFKGATVAGGAGPFEMRLRGALLGANQDITAKLDLPETTLKPAKVAGGPVSLGKPSLDVQASLDSASRVYRITRASLKTALANLDARGDVALDAQGKLAKLDGHLEGTANLTPLGTAAVAVGALTNTTKLAGKLKVVADIKASGGAFPCTATLTGQGIQINGRTSSGVQIPYGKLDLTGVSSPGWTKVEFKSASLMAKVLPAGAAAGRQPLEIKAAGRGTADLDAGRYEVSGLSVTMPDATLSTVASVVLPKSGNIGAATVRATANATGNIQSLFELARVWGVSLEDMDGSGSVTAQFEADGTLAQLAVKKLHAEVKDLVMKGSKAPAAIHWPQTLTCDIVTTVNAIDPLKTPIEILSGTARIAGIEVASLKGKLALDPKSDQSDLQIAGSLDPVALAAAAPGYFEGATVAGGAGPFEMRLRGALLGANQDITAKLDLPETTLKPARLPGGPVSLGKPSLNVQASLNLTNRACRVTYASLKTALANLDAQGNVVLNAQGKLATLDGHLEGAADLTTLGTVAVAVGALTNTTKLAGNLKVVADVEAGGGTFSCIAMLSGQNIRINGLKTTGVQIPYGEVDLTGVGSSGGAKIEFKSASLMAKILPAGAAANLQPLEIKMAGRGTADLNAGRYEVPELSVTMPGATLSTVASVVLPKSGDIGAATVRATANATGNIQPLFEVARVWGVSIEGMDGSGSVTAQLEADGTLAQLAVKKLHAEVKDLVMKGSKAPAAIRWPQTLTCDIVTTFNAVDPLKTPIEILSGTARIAGIEVASLKGKLALDPNSDQSDLQIAGSLDPVALAAAAPGYFKGATVAGGAGPFEMRLRGALLGANQDITAKLDLPETTLKPARLAGGPVSLGKPSLDVQASLDSANRSYRITRASLKTALANLDARGNVALDAQGKLAKLDGHLEGAADLTTLGTVAVAVGALTNNTELAGNLKVVADVKASGGAFPYTATLTGQNIRFKGPQTKGIAIDEPEPVAKLTGTFANTKDGFTVSIATGSELRAQTARGTISGAIRSLANQPLSAKNLVADLTYDPVRLKPLLTAFDAGEIRGTGPQPARIAFTGPLSTGTDTLAWLGGISLAAKLSYGTYAYTDVTIEGPPIAIEMKGGRLPLDYACKINGGATSLKGDVDVNKRTHLTLSAKDVGLTLGLVRFLGFLNSIVNVEKGAIQGAGSLDADVTYDGPLPLPKPANLTDLLTAKLTGKGSYSAKDLRIQGSPMLTEIANFVGQGQTDDAGDIQPTNFVIERGEFRMDKAVMHLNGLELTLAGTVRFDQTLNMQVGLPMPKRIRDANATVAQYLPATITVPVRGRVGATQVDYNAAASTALKDAGSNALKGKASDLMKGLFGGGKK